MKIMLLTIIALTVSIGFATADSGPTVKVLEHGTYSSSPGVTVGLTRQGLTHGAMDHIEQIESTRIVVGQLGNQFGFRYRLSGFPDGASVLLRMKMKFPPPGMVAPGKSVPFLEDEYTALKAAGANSWTTWTFDDRSQIVPGIWVFEIWYGDKKLAEEKFTVVLPPIA